MINNLYTPCVLDPQLSDDYIMSRNFQILPRINLVPFGQLNCLDTLRKALDARMQEIDLHERINRPVVLPPNFVLVLWRTYRLAVAGGDWRMVGYLLTDLSKIADKFLNY